MPKLPPLTRRTFVALSAGSAAAATLGPWNKVYAAPPNTVTVLDENPGTLMNRLAGLKAQGYRPLSVAVYGSPTKNATTFVQRTGPDWDLVAAMTKADLDVYMWAGWLTGYRLTHLAATGPANNPIFIAVSEASTIGTAPVAYLTSGADTTVGTIQHALRAAREGGNIPVALAMYGTSTDPRYAMTVEPNPNPRRIVWNAEGINETAIAFRNRLAAHTQQRARPSWIHISPGLMYGSMFRSDEYSSYPVVESALTSAQMNTAINTHRAAGRYPVHITANNAGGVTQFAGIFTTSEQIATRTVTRSGTDRSWEIDQLMISAMNANHVRHGSLAIVNRHRRLVYCRAFKLAEFTYKEVSPTSHFRLASISKTLASMLTLEMIQNGGAALPLALNTPIHTGVPLTQPNGSAPVANWNQITVEHILRHVSGIGDITRPEVVAQAFGGASMPITKLQMARWGCGQPLAFTPGSPPPPFNSRPHYSNMAFVVLSQLIENCTASSFLGQLRNRILTPLGANRVRVSPGPLSSHPADEAAYDGPQHNPLWGINVGPSVYTAARPMVPYVYGADLNYLTVDAGSGLSAAAPDLAKILTSLAGAAGSVLNATNRDRMLVRGGSLASPTPAAWAETRIGFDHSGGAARGGEKGGWFLGTSTVARVAENGWSFVMLFNSSDVPGNHVTDLTTLLNRAASPPLADGLGCLFPSFGIPSF